MVAGQSNYVFALGRYNANGSLDTSFNGTGKVKTVVGTNSAGSGVAVQSDGKIIAAGFAAGYGLNSNDFALVRYLGSTAPLSSFRESAGANCAETELHSGLRFGRWISRA